MVEFPSLVKGERFKSACVMLHGFESHLYYNPYHIKTYDMGCGEIGYHTILIFFIRQVEFRVRSPASQYILI
jgi:hypothetical protein